MEESLPSLICTCHVFKVGLLLRNSVSSLPSVPTVNDSRWQTLKNVCYIRWFGIQGLSLYCLGPVTGPLRMKHRPEALVWERAFPCHLRSLLPEGRAKNGHRIWNSAGDMEHWSACHGASRHGRGQWYTEIWNASSSPLLFQLNMLRNYSTFILDISAAHDFQPEQIFAFHPEQILFHINVRAWNSVTFM